MVGAKGLPQKWIAPLNDTLHTGVDGYNKVSISGHGQKDAGIPAVNRRERLMGEALEEAGKALALGEVPVGAVVALGTG